MSCTGCDHREKPKGSGIYVWCNKENRWVSEHVDAHETAVPCPNHSDTKRNIPIADWGELDGHPRSVRKHRKRST